MKGLVRSKHAAPRKWRIERARATAQPFTIQWIIAAVLGVAMFASGCGSTSERGATTSPRHGGTIYLETAQEPPTLNTWLASGGMLIARTVTDPLHAPWIRLDDHGRWIPVLATAVPSIANGLITTDSQGRATVTVPIRNAATWSDGAPINCADFQFTWRTVMNEKWQIGSRIGWSSIQQIDCPNPHTAQIKFNEPYAPFLQDILATYPLPRHALQHANFNTVWNNRITVSSGPFRFVRWDRGSQLIMERNPQWWGAGRHHLPYLDRIVVRFVPDAQTMKLDLRMEDADLIGLAPDTDLPQELNSIHTADHAILPGSSWEQLSFNTAAWPLDDVRVRQAVAHAIDRDVITDVVLRGQVPRLDSTLLPSQTRWYRPVFADITPDQSQVTNLMQRAGYTRKGTGPWTRHGRPVKLVLRSVAGNPLRAKAVQIMQAQLAAAGFPTQITLLRTEIFFAQYIAPGDYHLAIYSFGHGPEPSQAKIFACSEIPRAPDYVGKNNFRYCSPDVDAAVQAADRELDPGRRIALLARVQEGVARDMPTLPLFQPPDTLAWDKRLAGIKPNPMGRHTWNTEDWWARW